MAINRDSTTPPPKIGKIGPYTVFMTPPSTPTPTPTPQEQEQEQQQQQLQQQPEKPVFDSPRKVVLPSVQAPPPQQLVKPAVAGDGSVVGFFKNAVIKVQNAHSSLDDHLARWFGLNQSKYQWALDDYYESKGLEKGNAKAQEVSSKMQSV